MGFKRRIPPRPKLPRNTVTFNLNGTDEDVLASYREAHAHMHYWFFCRSPFRVRVGNRILYTTPDSGTFYLAVTFQGRWVVFVIIARIFWLVGFYNENGFFQMLFENRIYMDHAEVVLTGFSGNHGKISGNNVKDTRLGPHWTREGLKDISSYRGPGRSEAKDFRSSIGRFVTLLMESKYAELYARCCDSISGDSSLNRLGDDGADNLVHGWSTRSERVMLRINSVYGTADEVEEALKILSELYLCQLDGYNEGIFTHEPLPPVPRKDVWEPVDDGEGDKNVGQPQTRQARSVAPETLHRNAVRRSDKNAQKKSLGLRGGGAGGRGQAPGWFEDWLLGGDNENRCNLVVAETMAMGLKVTKRQLIVQSTSTTSQMKADKSVERQKDGSKREEVTSNDKNPLGRTMGSKSAKQETDLSKSSPGSNQKDRTLSNIRKSSPDTTQGSNLRKANPSSNKKDRTLSNIRKSSPDTTQGSNLRKANPSSNQKDRTLSNIRKSSPDTTQGSNLRKANPSSSSSSRGAKESEQERNLAKPGNSSKDAKKIEENPEKTPMSSSCPPVSKGLEDAIKELEGPNFIGDRTIDMVFNHLSATYPDAPIAFVEASNSHLLAHGDADAAEIIDTSALYNLFPVNDNQNHEYGKGEGMHWSLLILDGTGPRPRFVHLDSIGGFNSPAARRLADAIRTVVPNAEEEVMEADTPIQTNGWDCGLFVIAMARTFARWWANGDGGGWEERIHSEVDSEIVADLRLQLLQVLLGNLSLAGLD